MKLAPSPSSGRRHRELDGLRALACMAVFGVHLQQLTGLHEAWGPFDVRRLLENGNTGVALFFLLSGFHLSLPYWRGGNVERGLGAGSYVLRRVLRIVPAYYACLAALTWHQGLWQDAAGRTDVLRHALFAHNFWEVSFYSINNPFWTIAVQAQFYVVLPLALWILQPVARRGGLGIGMWVGLGVAAYVAHAVLMERGPAVDCLVGSPGFFAERSTVFSHSLMAHLPHFFWGVACGGIAVALGNENASDAANGTGETCFWLAALAIPMILATRLDDLLQVPHGRYNWPFVPALLGLVVLAAPRAAVAGRILGSWPLRSLGEISYGIYVYHLPCLRFSQRICREFFDTNASDWLVLAMVGWILTLLVAAISYLALERPLIRWAHRSHRGGEPSGGRVV